MLERQRNSNSSRRKHIRLIPVTLPIQEIVQQLNELQPAMIAGYVSALRLLAQEQLGGRLNIHPSIVISSAEPLSPENRSLIQKAFGVPPRNNYGCSEGGVIGYECRLGRMHINADWIIFEPVNAEHNPIWAPVLSTLLFSIYHVWIPWRWTQTAVGFLPLALAAWRTRSIYVSMIAHVTVNNIFLLMLTASFPAG